MLASHTKKVILEPGSLSLGLLASWAPELGCPGGGPGNSEAD